MAKDFCLRSNNRGEREGEGSLRVNQCSAAVRPAATIRASTTTVVNSENFRSELINFSPFNPPRKVSLLILHNLRQKSSRFRLINTLPLPLFIKIGQNSTLNLLAYRPLTLLTSRVVFPACRNSRLRNKGERRQTFTFKFFRSLGYGLE